MMDTGGPQHVPVFLSEPDEPTDMRGHLLCRRPISSLHGIQVESWRFGQSRIRPLVRWREEVKGLVGCEAKSLRPRGDRCLEVFVILPESTTARYHAIVMLGLEQL